MNRSLLTKCLFYATAILAVSFPVFPLLVQISVMLVLFNYLLTNDWSRRLQEIKSSNLSLLLILFFILNLIGLFWSENLQKGLLHIEIKASLLLMPFLVLARPDLNENLVSKIKTFFAGSAFIIALFLLLRSFFVGFVGRGSWLIYGEFSPLFHPSYLSMYFLFAIVLMFDKGNQIIKLKSIYIFLIVSVLGASVFFLASKLNVFLLFLILLFQFIRIIKGQFSTLKIYILSTVFILGTLTAFYLNQSIYERFAVGWETIKNPEAIQLNDTESNAARLLIWRSAVELIIEHPFGVGTGDVNIELSKKYHENGYIGIESKQLNAHNQFLQTSVAIGILGMCLLLLIMLIPFVQSIVSKDYVFAGFLFIVFSNALVEAILEAQAGVIFFGFFYSLLLRNARSN